MACGPNITVHSFTRVTNTSWDIRFRVETAFCRRSAGRFTYSYLVVGEDGTQTVDRRAPSWDVQDGDSFILRDSVSIGSGEMRRVFGMREIECTCQSPKLEDLERLMAEWNPYEGCGNGPALTGNGDPRWVAGLISGLVQLAYVYEVAKNGSGSNFTAGLEQISGALSKITSVLNDISSDLDEIIKLLKNLPLAIRGEVDAALVNQSLGYASAASERIMDACRPDYIEQSLPALERSLDKLHDEINAIKSVRGVTGLFIVAPLLGTWLAGQIVLQKAKRKYLQFKIESPWGKSLMRTMSLNFQTTYEQIEQTKQLYVANLPVMPTHNRYVERRTLPGQGEVLVRTSFDGVVPEDDDRAGISFSYVLRCASAAGGSEAERIVVRVPHPLGPPGRWMDAWLPRSGYLAEDTRMLKAFDSYRSLRTDMLSFFGTGPALLQARDSILLSFTEPEGIWEEEDAS